MRSRIAAAVVPVLVASVLSVTAFAPGASASYPVSPETRGSAVVVGAFRVHTSLQERTVTVTKLVDEHAAPVPVTEFAGVFLSGGRGSASLSFTVRNTGTATLFGPLDVVVMSMAPPSVRAANPDSGTGPGTWTWRYGPALLGGDDRLAASELSGARRLDFASAPNVAFNFDVQIRAGVPLAPGEGGTIIGSGGTSVTVAPNSISYEVLIDIARVPASEIVAPTGAMPLLVAAELTYEPVALNASFPPPTAPLTLSATPPAGTPPPSEVIVGLQTLSDFVGETESGLRQQLVAVDTAVPVGGALVTQANVLPGVFGAGVYAFLTATGSGFATGTVSDANGPRPGAVVSNSTNTLVSISDGSGRYALFISGGPFTVTGFDPFRGSSGSASGDITVHGSTVTANIGLNPLATPPITRDGVRNGGFERGDLTSWATTGAATARQQLACSGATLQPTEGQQMADVTTGPGSIGGTGSALRQRFTVPAGVRNLRVDFNFVSEEFPEFVGSIFNDSFRATITTPTGETTFAQVSVNDSGGFSLVGDCGFPGGDGTTGTTGWRTGSVDVSAFAGTDTPIQVDLLFSANDAGDNIYDTHVLVDNIRFSTVWVDAKIIAGANADAARVRNEVRAANEILSQAGINVRIRDTRAVADPGGLADTDITWTTGPSCADGRVNGRLTAEEGQLMGLSRSATATDVNVYYVRSGTGLAGVGGFAIGPDDFCVDVTSLGNSGTLQMDIGTGGNILAHELGHLLISPHTAGHVLEHNAAAGNFLSTTPALGTVNRQQSANINRAGAPFLLP